MNRSSELNNILSKFLKWNNARLSCFTKMLLSLFAVKTVNLREIANAFSSPASIDSRYKRIKRFFSQVQIDSKIITLWIFSLFFTRNQKLYITIDRTNWFFGKSKINILVVGVAYEGVSIPLYWDFLNKAGNAKAIEHQASIERFISLFGKQCIAGVLADREFGNTQFIRWLNENKIPFFIRIKQGFLLKIKHRKFLTAEKLFKNIRPKEKYYFAMDVNLFGEKVFLAGSRSERGELMIVATNQNPKNAISIYLRRWEIECLFQSLKSRGFHFENTHLTKTERLNKLITLLAMGFCWAHKVGEWKAKLKPIRFNHHRESLRPQATYFKYGLELIRDTIINPFKQFKLFKKLVSLIYLDEWRIAI